MTRPIFERISSAQKRLAPKLASRRVPLWAAIVGMLLTSPSLFGGFATEDWVMRALVRSGAVPLSSHSNLFGHGYSWSAADVARRNWNYELLGWFPWLTDPRFDASFFRPLSSLTHHFDYRVLRDLPVIMHAESVLWYGGLCAAVAVLHRRFVGVTERSSASVAGLSALLYAADDAHGHPVGWLMNRNAVMATLFAVLALVSYDRYRRDGYRPGALLTTVFFGIGLCSAEFALCATGYFVAHVLFIDRAPVADRLRGALAWAAPLVVWAVVYRALGHATHGSGIYIDPVTSPLNFAFELFERSFVLLAGQFAAPFADSWTRANAYAQGFLSFWAALVVWCIGRTVWPLVKADRVVAFWTFGFLLSLPPACATFPEDRLLFFAGIGAFPLVAAFIAETFSRPEAGNEPRRANVVLASAFLLLHAFVGPALLPSRSLHMFRYDRRIEAAGETALGNATASGTQSLIVVNGEDFYFTGMMPMIRAARGESTPPRMITLAGTLEKVSLLRLDDRRVLVTPENGFQSRVFDRIYRSRDLPFARSKSFDLGSIQITAAEVNQWGEPTSVIFSFPLALENRRYAWVSWKNDHYEAFAPPQLGQVVVVHD